MKVIDIFTKKAEYHPSVQDISDDVARNRAQLLSNLDFLVKHDILLPPVTMLALKRQLFENPSDRELRRTLTKLRWW